MILAIDPGPTESAYVLYADRAIESFAKLPNDRILTMLRSVGTDIESVFRLADVLVIEKIASYGMPVGEEVFETCRISGRFAEAWGQATEWITRGQVKMHLCQSMRAKDGNVRQALIDLFGGESARGKKATPGPLYGISGDCWSALAVAVTYANRPKTRAA